MITDPKIKNTKSTDSFILQEFQKQITFRKMVGRPKARNVTAGVFSDLGLEKLPKVDLLSSSKTSYHKRDEEEMKPIYYKIGNIRKITSVSENHSLRDDDILSDDYVTLGNQSSHEFVSGPFCLFLIIQMNCLTTYV